MLKPEIVESTKDTLKLRFADIDEGFLTLVKDELWRDKATELAGYRVTHPEAGYLLFTLKTKGKSAKTVWNNALKSLDSQVIAFSKALKRLNK